MEKGGWEDAASRDPNPMAVMELYKGVSIMGAGRMQTVFEKRIIINLDL